MKRIVLLAMLSFMIMASGFAQEPLTVELKFNELIQKYEKVKGVECMTLVKGRGLGMVKMMFNQEFDVSKEKQFADNDYIRCFASASESGLVSDFVIALENDNSKMIMYMAGTIKVE